MFKWICPFCDHSATIGKGDYIKEDIRLSIESKKGYRIVEVEYIVCPNPECHEFSLSIDLFKAEYLLSSGPMMERKLEKSDVVNHWDLIPRSKAKKFPSYIPRAILEDYEEACSIIDFSPKAAATLSRRCLQGMIRDFWGVRKNRLSEEINAIKDKVEPQTWGAINAVKEVGNIGAHMEKDVNLIIEIEPNEAELLINLIEILIKDWYINKHEREEKLKRIIELGKNKASQKKSKKSLQKQLNQKKE